MSENKYQKAKLISNKIPIPPCHDWKELSTKLEGWSFVSYLKCKHCGIKAKYYGSGNIIVEEK